MVDSPEKEKRKAEIKARAKRVYNISFDYHLTHAVFGSYGLLAEDRKKLLDAERENIKKAIEAAIQAKDRGSIEKLTIEKETLKNATTKKYHILIEYSPTISDNFAGRVVNVGDKQLEIILPRKALVGVLDKDTGQLNGESIKNVRKKMAHELGHIVLHTDKFTPDNLGGSETIKDLDWEADLFAEELLSLYREKDHRIDLKEDWPETN